MFSFLSKSSDGTTLSESDEKENESNESSSSTMPGNDDNSQLITDLTQQLATLKQQLDVVQQQNNSSSSSATNVVNAVTEVKLTAFYENDPELWFSIIEAQFESRKITSERSKYFHVVSHLSSSIAQQVKNVISTGFADGKFEQLKQALITTYAETATEKFEKLISNESLGDMKPSLALNKIKALASNTVTEDFIKKLWLKRLPQSIKQVLSASSDPLDNLSQMADKMWEVTDRGTICGVEKGNSLDKTLQSIQQQLQKMANRLNAIENNRTSRRDSTPHRSRNRSQSSKRTNDTNDKSEGDATDSEMCWYHRKMGERAKRCRSPCTFDSKN